MEKNHLYTHFLEIKYSLFLFFENFSKNRKFLKDLQIYWMFQ